MVAVAAMSEMSNVDYLTVLAALIVLFVLGTSLEILVHCRRFFTWISTSFRAEAKNVEEVPKHYTYRRGSVSHSWREASLEPILSHTSEYDTLSSEYDSEKNASTAAAARVTEAYTPSPSSFVNRPTYTTTPPSSPGPPRRIHTPCDELVPERTTRGQAHATVAAMYGNGGGVKVSGDSRTGSSESHQQEVMEDMIEVDFAQRSFAAAPPPPMKKPPPTKPKPKKGANGVNGRSHGTDEVDGVNGGRRRSHDLSHDSSHDTTDHHTDHQISYQNISKKVTQDTDKFWLIFSGEYTKAMDQDWHSGHFCCWNCDLNLTGHRYILREEHPYCIKCYENLFANSCEECKTPIGTDSKDLSYKDKHWHEKCFKCVDCTNSLVDQPFSSRDNKLYCADCHDNNFAARCDGCTNIFKAGMKKFEYKGKQWHEECFCCSVCKQPIGNKSFIPRDQEVVCVPCYEENFAQRCLKCQGVINKGGITYKGSPWHKDCFTCTNCNKTLSGEKFTSREDKPYCADCFGELFAKKCIKCTKAITGLGGTKFISFEERHWHSDCFMCYRCNSSLVGRGFLTDGDDILCPECGRA